jgi:lysine biosynthesis protein LysW
MATVFCLDCDRKITLHPNQQVGDSVICSSCNSEFEIVNLDPPEIEWSYDDYEEEEEEDWDDDEEWEDDDDDDDWDDDSDDEEDWSWMIAKRQRIQSPPSASRRSRSREFDYE